MIDLRHPRGTTPGDVCRPWFLQCSPWPHRRPLRLTSRTGRSWIRALWNSSPADLEATLEVVGKTLVPRYADAVVLALADWRDVVRIAAVQDRDADRRRALTLHLHEIDGLTLAVS